MVSCEYHMTAYWRNWYIVMNKEIVKYLCYARTR